MITVFTSVGCGICHQLKKILDSKGIEYLEKQEYAEIIERNLMSFPVVKIEEENYIMGTDTIKWALKL